MIDRNKLAKNLGVTRQHIDHILAGRRTPSTELAAQLEKLTGVGRLCWLYPSEYPNPLVVVNNGAATKN